MVFKKSVVDKNLDSWWLTCLIFCVSVVILMINSGLQNVWYDEGVTLFNSNKSLEELIEFSKVDNNPPLYNILLHYWSKLFGYSIWVSRLLSAIFMGGSVVLIYKIGKQLYSPFLALLSIVFFLNFNQTEYYGIEIRAYGLMLFFSLMCWYHLLNLYRSKQFYHFLLWAVSLVLIFFTHYASAPVIVLNVLLILPYIFNPDNLRRQGILILATIIPALIVVWNWLQYPLLNSETVAGESFWLKSPTWINFKQTVGELMMVLGWEIYLYFTLLLASIVSFFFYKKDGKGKRTAVVLAFLLFTIPLLSYALSQKIPMFGTRYILYLVPVILFTFFFLLEKLPKVMGYALALGFLVLTLFNPSKDIKRSNYTELVEYVNSTVGENKLIILNESYMALPYLINQYGNVYRSDNSLNQEYKKNDLLPTSVADFSKFPDLEYLRAFEEIMYVRSFEGTVDPTGIISKMLSTDFELMESNNNIYAFHTEHFIRKENVPSIELKKIKFTKNAEQEGFKAHTNAFDNDPGVEYISIKKENDYALNTQIDFPSSYKLNRLSELNFDLPLKILEMNVECFVVAQLKDENGENLHYKTVKIIDQEIAYGEWKNYNINLQIGHSDGRSISCYIWNKGQAIFDVKPFEVSLTGLIQSSK